MTYNQRTDYRVADETARKWWKSIPPEKFSVMDASAANSGTGKEVSNGPWVVSNPEHTEDLAGVVTQPLEDGSGQWGLAVLWYDREKCSHLARVFQSRKLTRSQAAAAIVGDIVLQQGGKAWT